MPERTDYWGIPHDWISPEIFVYTIMGLAVLVFLFRFFRRFSLWWRVGRPERRWDHLLVRFGRVFNYTVVQTRVLSQRYPGVMHAAIAWAFFVFFLGTALATIDTRFVKFLQGNTYLVYKLVLDLFTIIFVIGVALAAYRRFVQQPSRLTLQSGFVWSLVLITVVVVGGLLVESLRLAVEQPPWAIWTPAGWPVARLWIATGASDETLLNWHTGMWAIHLLSVALLFMVIPVSTLAHIINSPLNVFFSNLDRSTGQLKPVGENGQGEPVYVSSLRDLTWKQLLDGDACTECGRCQDACPSFAAGTSLSPKELMLSLRNALHQNGNGAALVGETITGAMLWPCTTCAACIRECPGLVEHLDMVVDMRRALVIDGQVDAELQDALANLGRYGNSFGKSGRARARWSRKVEPKIKDARKEQVEYLWFVGDYASYNAGLTDITQMTAEVFQTIGLDFGLLYDGENNAGNDVRRVGEEGLFEMLVEKNVAALEQSGYQAIVTTDPHSFTTLKNEYPPNGSQPVLHYTELLDQLITSGQLKFNTKLNYKITYHDPCYLGRYNGVFDAPRRIIAATGCELVEMPRHGDRAFCCGAGGGRIWMEEGEMNERPSETRIREAAALDGVGTLVVACPKDVSMFRDAVKTTGFEEQLAVKDLIELVHEAL